MKRILTILCLLLTTDIYSTPSTYTIIAGLNHSSYYQSVGGGTTAGAPNLVGECLYFKALMTAAGLTASDTISAIQIHNASASGYNCKNLRIYLGNTSQTIFTSTSNWVPTSRLTKVYGPTTTAISGNASWTMITLATKFPYNYDSTLVVLVAHDTNSVQSKLHYDSTVAVSPNYRRLYKYATTLIDESSLPTGTRDYDVAALRITCTGMTAPPPDTHIIKCLWGTIHRRHL